MSLSEWGNVSLGLGEVVVQPGLILQQFLKCWFNTLVEVTDIGGRPAPTVGEIDDNARSPGKLAVAGAESVDNRHTACICIPVGFAGGECVAAISNIILAKSSVHGQSKNRQDSDWQSDQDCNPAKKF